ncbi:signal recognition particle-docking protein FtsY [Nitrososphaera sp. AFS]|uniref:signal recognition particle-docking protein FtsY n=1 Tax=Nitrososphaera sp. AFS TaxID=2301191 RepID=UPI00139225A1|nr:signal recognition particle-docking protein FtsY [Nitrososphaera sp. AFS]NAL77453.1 signal recognition particle-docking protein FtsY [Nitrososphaera sp. AFS]
MFDQLKRVFSNATKSLGQKDLSERDVDNVLYDLQLGLLESDVAQNVIDDLSVKLKKELVGLRLEKDQDKEDLIRAKFQRYFEQMLANAGTVDLIGEIKRKSQSKGGPFIIVFLGINGTGKTTTVAKIANLLRKNDISLVVAAADTHRAGAIEQLTQHAERLGVKVIAQSYGADPSAVGRDAVDYGRKHYVEAVLIDTAGRMQTAKGLMDEIGKIVKVVKPDLKLFVGDSLAGNDTINQATDFFEYTKFDGAILTKSDADAKGGAAVSIVYSTSKPIVYLGVGQGYEDIVPFDSNNFIKSLFGNTELPNENFEPASKYIDIEMPTAKPIVAEHLYKMKELTAEIKGSGELKNKNESDSLPYQTEQISPTVKEETKSDPSLKPKTTIVKADNTQEPAVKNESSQELEFNRTEKKSIFSKFFKRNKKEKNESLIDVNTAEQKSGPDRVVQDQERTHRKTGADDSKKETIYLTDEDLDLE